MKPPHLTLSLLELTCHSEQAPRGKENGEGGFHKALLFSSIERTQPSSVKFPTLHTVHLHRPQDGQEMARGTSSKWHGKEGCCTRSSSLKWELLV